MHAPLGADSPWLLCSSQAEGAREPEVADDDVAVAAEEQVARLDVAVDDALLLQTAQSFQSSPLSDPIGKRRW